MLPNQLTILHFPHLHLHLYQERHLLTRALPFLLSSLSFFSLAFAPLLSSLVPPTLPFVSFPTPLSSAFLLPPLVVGVDAQLRVPKRWILPTGYVVWVPLV